MHFSKCRVGREFTISYYRILGIVGKEWARVRQVISQGIALAGVLLTWCPCVCALDPSLDVSQYAHTAWKIRDGFTKGSINAIAQTPDGYLWLGTEFGLLRFDGVRAVPWQPPADQHLPSNDIWSLLAARDGSLWIGTAKGLTSWRHGKLTQYHDLDGHYVNRLLEDRVGLIWASGLASPNGKLCAIQNGSVQCHGEDGSLGVGVVGLHEDTKGNLWAGVLNGLWRWKPGPPHFYPIPGSVDSIRTFSEDNDGTLLISTRGGIQRFVDGKTEPYQPLRVTQQFQTREMLRDHDHGLWIGTSDRGIVHVHQGRIDVFTSTDGFSGGYVNDLLEDREGNIWVVTDNGLDRFRDLTVTTFSVEQGLSNTIVGSVLASGDGSVWFGTNSALDRWNNGQFTTYDKRAGKLTGQNPNSLFQNSRGRIWVSVQDGVGHLENGRFVPVGGIPGGTVHAFAEDKAGNLWIANQQLGLFHLLPGNMVEQVPWSRLGRKDHATALAADPSQGGLWLGFFNGGVAYFADGKVQSSYSSANGLGEGPVNDLRFDRDGTLWAATDGGFSRLKNGHVATLTSKNGLPCDGVNWMMEDDAHSLWLNMPCGLARIARSDLDAWAVAVDKGDQLKGPIHATVFDGSDGVRSRGDAGGYTPRAAKSTDGKLWFTGLDGAGVIDPRHILFNSIPPPVHVEQLIADRKSFDVSENLHLPPLVRDLEIDYTALSLVVPEKVLFRYKLEGFDRDWQDVGNRRQAFYTNLTPRTYRFRVIACNNSGVWNETGDSLEFSIAPAYYQTTWFKMLCAAAFLALLWALYLLRLQQLRHQFTIGLEARVNERTRIARELHDTLLQSLHGVMFQFQAARNLLPRSPEQAMTALDGAILETEQAIAESRDAIQDLRTDPASHADLAELLTATGQELAEARKADHRSPVFRLIVEGDRRTLSADIQDEVYRIAHEILRNAFQHAQADRIEAEIRYDDQELRLRLRDDGIGVDPKVLEQGGRPGHWGLRGIHERAKEIGAELDFWSEAGVGTEVQLTIPAGVAYDRLTNFDGCNRDGRESFPGGEAR
jgi:signal transduction histidine kinase/ligand-binding sensor domain-containing protein